MFIELSTGKEYNQSPPAHRTSEQLPTRHGSMTGVALGIGVREANVRGEGEVLPVDRQPGNAWVCWFPHLGTYTQHHEKVDPC